jgi:hypothetical protein
MAGMALVEDFHSICVFNEDGMMLLMRRTGWARTNIGHGNGRNDCAWLHGWLLRYTSITFNVKKGSDVNRLEKTPDSQQSVSSVL